MSEPRRGRLPRRARERLTAFVHGGPAGHVPVRAAGVAALSVGVLVLVVLALWLGGRVVVTAVALQQAQGSIRHFGYQLSASQTPSSTALQRDVQRDTAIAASTAGDPVWRAGEHLPLLGPNLQSLRQTAQVLDGLVTAAQPLARAAEGLSLKSLRPSSGIDLQPLRAMPQPYARFDDALARAERQAQGIRTAGTIGPLHDQVAELQQALQQARPVSAEVRKVLPLAYSILGGYGRRYYLLMFQNNAEERASGGNPAVIALLKVEQGRLKLDRQLNSSEFPHPFEKAVRSYGAAYDRIYGDHVGRYVTNTTFTPDFPTTASLTRTMWQKVTKGSPVDGVISFDPVALSYLLKATGPITLKGGDVLTSKNAVSYLLSDVYALHPNVKVQNQIFASAAASIFGAVTKGQGGLTKYLEQVPRMVAEQRLKAWSVRESEERLLMASPLGTMLPSDDRTRTVLGVYNNDDATSKMSYYLDDTIDVQADLCRATPRYTVRTTVTNTLTTAKAKTVSDFVLAHQADIPFGGDRQWVQLYGPVGSRLVGVTVDGRKVVWGTDIQADLNTNPDATGVDIRRPAVKGRLYGRPVGTVSITVPARATVTVTGIFAGGTTPSRTVAVSHTPRVRAVPVTVQRTACG